MTERLLLIGLLLTGGCDATSGKEDKGQVPKRIVSLAPNITESVCALGLEHALVGTTASCGYPPSVRRTAKVGDFGQFNYEAILKLNPDLVILHSEFIEEKTRLDSLGISYLETGSYHVDDILESIRHIGAACGVQKRSSELIEQISIQIRTAGEETHRVRPRVLLTFGGSADSEIGQVHAFGTECLHHELLELAGGENVLHNSLPYSILSREALLRLDPEIIIVLAPELENPESELTRWQRFSGLQAVKQNRVYVLNGDYLCIPGPRFVQILEDFVRIIQHNDGGQSGSVVTDSATGHHRISQPTP